MIKSLLFKLLLVSRSAPNVYTVHGYGTLTTAGCTQTAHLMDAKVVRDPLHRPRRYWLVFIDRNGEEEGECEVTHAQK